MSRPAYDAIVLGAGIVGAACARALAGKKQRVAVVERDIIGGGATAAGMGHVVVMDDSAAQFALTRYSRQLWSELFEVLPADCECEACGTLWAAADAEEMDAVFVKKRSYEQAGVRAEVLDAAAIKDAEPHLRPGMAGGLRVPDDGVVYPPCVARWMIEQAQALGAELVLGNAAVTIDDGGVTLADGTRLAAGKIVVAAGMHASRLLRELPIRPRKGHLVITDRYPGFARHQIVELGYVKSAGAATGDSVAFNLQPRRTGQLLLAIRRRFGGNSLALAAADDRPRFTLHARFGANESNSCLDGTPRRHARQAAAYRPLLRCEERPSRNRARRLGDHYRDRHGGNDRSALSWPRPGDSAGALLARAVLAGEKNVNTTVSVLINEKPGKVSAGWTVAAALDFAGVNVLRKSVGGEPRGPMCGMGICFECRVTINGQSHQRACQTLCSEGMEIVTDA